MDQYLRELILSIEVISILDKEYWHAYSGGTRKKNTGGPLKKL
jgi:hypothetical protein